MEAHDPDPSSLFRRRPNRVRPMVPAVPTPDEVAPLKRSRSYDDGDLETLRMLVGPESMQQYAASSRRYFKCSEEDTARRSAAGGPAWGWQFDRTQLDAALVSRTGVWNRARERRVGRETGRRVLTLDDAEVACAVGPGKQFRMCPRCRDPLVLPIFLRCGHACCSGCTVNSALVQEACIACSKQFDSFEKSSSSAGGTSAVTLAISVSESGLTTGWSFNWSLGAWFFDDSAFEIPSPVKAWVATADVSSSSSAPLAAAAAIVLYGTGTFLTAFADKSGGQDWTGTLLMIGVGKLAGSTALCRWFNAPVVVAPWSPGAWFGVLAPMLYAAAFLFTFALVSQGADMSVVMPATQLSVLLPAAFGVVSLGETVTVALVCGTVAMLAGAVLLSLQADSEIRIQIDQATVSNHTDTDFQAVSAPDEQGREMPASAFVPLLLGAVLGMGFGQICFIQAARRCENWRVAMGSSIFGNVLTLLLAAVFRLSLCTFDAGCEALSVRSGLVTIGAHVVLACGSAAYTIMMSTGDAALYAAITTLQVAVPITLGIAVLGETLNAVQYSGVFLCCGAAFVLGCGGK